MLFGKWNKVSKAPTLVRKCCTCIIPEVIYQQVETLITKIFLSHYFTAIKGYQILLIWTLF